MSDQQQQPATTPSSAQPAQPQASSQTGSQEQGGQGQGQTSGQQQQAPDAPMKQEESDAPSNTDIDTAIDADVEMNTDENIATNGAAGGAGADETGVGNSVQDDNVPTSVDALAAATAPSKKETSLREFLGKMDEYAPIIPDAVTAHYLTLAGLPPPGNGPNQTPPHLARLLALAAQKFIADIAADSYQYARIRASNSSSASNPMGSLNAASGLGVPGAAGAGAGAAGAAAGASGGGESSKGKANTHLGIQRPGFGGGGSGGSGQGRTVLTMEDLGMAVSEYGVSVKRGEFYR